MTKTKGRIGVTEFVSLLFVCRAMTLFTFLLPENTGLRQGDRPFLAFPYFLFGLLAALPTFILRKNGPRTLLDVTDCLSGTLTKICSVLFSGYALWVAALGEARFTLLTGTVLLRGTSNFWPVLLLTLTAGIVVLKGMEAIGRTAGVIAAVLIAAIVFVLCSTADRFDITNLEIPLRDGFISFALNGFRAVARTPEFFILLLIGDSVSENMKRGIPIFLTFFGITAGIVFLFITGVLGQYGELQILPLYTLTSLAKSGVLERLDTLLCGLWVLCAVLRSAIFLWVAMKTLDHSFSYNKKQLIGLCSAFVAGTALILAGNETRLMKLAVSGVSEIGFLVFVVFFPFVLMVLEYRKKRRSDKCQKGI